MSAHWHFRYGGNYPIHWLNARCREFLLPLYYFFFNFFIYFFTMKVRMIIFYCPSRTSHRVSRPGGSGATVEVLPFSTGAPDKPTRWWEEGVLPGGRTLIRCTPNCLAENKRHRSSSAAWQKGQTSATYPTGLGPCDESIIPIGHQVVDVPSDTRW